jgi:uncharacterized membrane protein YozB (DUF420 family)
MPQLNASTITLLAYLVVLVPLMLLGFYFARRKMFSPHHKLVMTSIVILNWIFIAAVMAVSYSRGVAPNLPDDIGQIKNLLPTIHLLTGGIAQLLATYLIILMWTENTALERLAIIRTRNIKPLMRTTLALWLLTVLLGIGIFTINQSSSATAATVEETPTAEAVSPDTTEEPDAPDATEEAPDPDATEESED